MASITELSEKRFALSSIYCPMQSMKRIQLFWATLTVLLFLGTSESILAKASPHNDALVKPLQDVYNYWQKSMELKSYKGWKQITAKHRIRSIENRIRSEKGNFPADVFNLPSVPPTLEGLKPLRARSNGVTAKLVCFGKVNFGVGGAPTDNLLVISFQHEGGRWKYDVAEFVNLTGLPTIRKQLQSGNMSYVDGVAFIPNGKPQAVAQAVPNAKYIAKVYTFCPGRDVNVTVNKVSKHRFQDIQNSEVVIGGIRDGLNEISYTIKDLPDYKGQEPITLRVYAFSQVPGVKPVKVFQYQTVEGEKPKASGKAVFQLEPADAAKILGK